MARLGGGDRLGAVVVEGEVRGEVPGLVGVAAAGDGVVNTRYQLLAEGEVEVVEGDPGRIGPVGDVDFTAEVGTQRGGKKSGSPRAST